MTSRDDTGMRDRIWAILSDKEWHTHKELHQVCNRYGARIHELRDLGYDILSRKAPTGKDYRMPHPTTAVQQRRSRVRVYLPLEMMQDLAEGHPADQLTREVLQDAIRVWQANH